MRRRSRPPAPPAVDRVADVGPVGSPTRRSCAGGRAGGAVGSGVAVVTGGDRGIGAAVVRAVAAAGWSVCLTYHRNEEAAAAVCDEVRAAGGVAEAVRADVAVEADVRAVF